MLSDSVIPRNQPKRPLPPRQSDDLPTDLHATLSDRTAVSHPLCTECMATLQEDLGKELDELRRERDAYIGFERGILQNREALKQGANVEKEGLGEYDIEGTQEEWDELMKRKEELVKEEEELREILKAKEAEFAKMIEEEARVKLEEEEMDREETE
jgi:beclin 1